MAARPATTDRGIGPDHRARADRPARIEAAVVDRLVSDPAAGRLASSGRAVFARVVFGRMEVHGTATSPAARASRAAGRGRRRGETSEGRVARPARGPDPDPSGPVREARDRLHRGRLVPGPTIPGARVGATRAPGASALARTIPALRDRPARDRAVDTRPVRVRNRERARGRAAGRRLAGCRRGPPISQRGAGPARTPSPARSRPTSGPPDPRSRAGSCGAWSRPGAAIPADRFVARVRPGRPTVARTSASGRSSTSRWRRPRSST